jgi:hypothetical protein
MNHLAIVSNPIRYPKHRLLAPAMNQERDANPTLPQGGSERRLEARCLIGKRLSGRFGCGPDLPVHFEEPADLQIQTLWQCDYGWNLQWVAHDDGPLRPHDCTDRGLRQSLTRFID